MDYCLLSCKFVRFALGAVLVALLTATGAWSAPAIAAQTSDAPSPVSDGSLTAETETTDSPVAAEQAVVASRDAKSPVALPEPLPEMDESDVTQHSAVAEMAPTAAPDGTASEVAPTLAEGPRPVWEESGQGANGSPLRFNRIEPGVTTLEQVRQQWGEPVKEFHRDGQGVLAYKVAGFKQVDVLTRQSIVDGVLIHLERTLPVEHVVLDLNLRGVRPVLIPDTRGNVLGQGYPERGVMLHYAVQTDETLVSEILLEPVRGELFRLRAEYDFEWNDSQDLADLQVAVQLDPSDARAHWLIARQQRRRGALQAATDSIAAAVAIEPNVARYQILQASLRADEGKSKEAIRSLRDLLQREDAGALEKAEAHRVLGDLLSLGPVPQYQEALEHHLKATQLSVESAGAEQFAVRRWAKEILIEAHLATARDIAGGYFQRQGEVVPKWLERAQRLAVEYVERDQGDLVFKMQLYRGILDAYVLLPTQFDPQAAIEQALSEGRNLIADHADTSFQRRVEWEMAVALFQAGEIERARGNADAALQFANNAVALFENARVGREPNPADTCLEGQLYFLLGAVHAVHRQDHAEAARWFQRAEPLLKQPISPSRYADYGLQGERFVSMGVSFWESHQQQRAVDVTLHGVSLIKQAISEGILDESSLAVPFGNLATMHQNLGNSAAAQRYAQMMNRAESDTVRR